MPTTLIRCAFCHQRVLPSEVVFTPRPAHPACGDRHYQALFAVIEKGR